MLSSSASGSGSASSGTSSVMQGIDTLTSAMKANIIPDQEYLLQGSVLDTHVDVLKHRLRGLCDNVDPDPAKQETFAEREMVFSIQGTMSTQPLTLRVRRQMDVQAMGGGGVREPCWQLRYVGQPELGQRATTVRSCYDIACGDNAVEFLTELGCRLDYEFVAKGFLFRKGRLRVTVSKIHRVKPAGPPGSTGAGNDIIEPMTNSHLIELSVLAPSGNDGVAEDMRNFSEQLKPLVVLDKIDPKRAGM